MHCISAMIGTPAALEPLRAALPSARIVDLPQGLALLPTVPEVIAEAGAGEVVGGFYKLTSTLLQLAERASWRGPIVYVETEYFGGGGQAALVFRGGRCGRVASTLEDEERGDDESPTSTALREIGVDRGDAIDEFDAIGLGRHRSTHAWHEIGR